jgi:hypothetical protein
MVIAFIATPSLKGLRFTNHCACAVMTDLRLTASSR